MRQIFKTIDCDGQSQQFGRSKQQLGTMQLIMPARKQRVSLVAEAAAILGGLAKDLGLAAPQDSVHGVRRRIKRLRSLLRLLREAIGEASYASANRHLKAAADALAGKRQAEALVVAATRLKTSRKAASELRHIIESGRPAEPTGGPDNARAALAAVAAAVQSWRLPSDHGALISAAFANTYRKARRLLAQGLKSGEAAELHEARKHVIHHLHHLELLANALPEPQVKRIAALEDLREALGDFNDLAEIAHLADAQDHTMSAALRKALKARRKTYLVRARKGWKPLFGEKTSAFVKRIGAMRVPGEA